MQLTEKQRSVLVELRQYSRQNSDTPSKDFQAGMAFALAMTPADEPAEALDMMWEMLNPKEGSVSDG